MSNSWKDVEIVFADGKVGPAKAAYSGEGWCDVICDHGNFTTRFLVLANGETQEPMNPCRLVKPFKEYK